MAFVPAGKSVTFFLQRSVMGGTPMTTEGLQSPVQNIVERNTKRINQLILEVEKLVDLLERQRLVEPSLLHNLKYELHAIQRGE
jgi:hypothetical protein